LIDNASDIVPEIKKEEVTPPKPPSVVAVTPKPVKKIEPPIATTKPVKKVDTPKVATVEPPKPKVVPKPIIEELSPERLREGQTIKIEKLEFPSNSSKIQETSFASLDEVFNLLNGNINLIVEIGGHTNLIMEDEASIRLSRDRAQSVADYLVKKGIERKRLAVKGYGKSKPIATETSKAANQLNQRVEIKILSTNG
jgi:outer membrane protein OmpA-like peptidoglycan-associated protein